MSGTRDSLSGDCARTSQGFHIFCPGGRPAMKRNQEALASHLPANNCLPSQALAGGGAKGCCIPSVSLFRAQVHCCLQRVRFAFSFFPHLRPRLAFRLDGWLAKQGTRSVSFCLESFPKEASSQPRAWPLSPPYRQSWEEPAPAGK